MERVVPLAAILLLLLPIDANSDNTSIPSTPWYMGAKLGYSYHEQACESIASRCDADGVSYGVFGGYRWTNHWGLELSLTQLPETKATYAGGMLTGELEHADINLQYYFSGPPSATSNNEKNAGLYVRAGGALWRSEVHNPMRRVENDGFRPTAGVGYDFSLSRRTNLRVEYQYIDRVGARTIGFTHVHQLSLKLAFGFLPTARPDRDPEPRTTPQPPISAPSEPPPEPPPETRVVVSENVEGPLFETASSDITSHEFLREIVAVLKSQPQLTVTVVGHTDSQGRAEYNQSLSQERARSVAQALAHEGVARKRIEHYGMGETAPVADNNTASGRAANRRVEFIIKGYRE